MKILQKGWRTFVVYYPSIIRTFALLGLGFLITSCEPTKPPEKSSPNVKALLIEFQAFVEGVNLECGTFKATDIVRLDKAYANHLRSLEKCDLTNDQQLRKTQIRLEYMYCRAKHEIGSSSNSWLHQIEKKWFQSISGNLATSSFKKNIS